LCDLVDLVISVDTSVAHLGGSLGRPTWVMLPVNADWRWMHGRSDSPWYPGMHLYRASKPLGWTDVIGAIAHDVEQRFSPSAHA
jgi:ADP-heptose:LPS heptosyltransferase